jgi:hypothetical protein
MIIQDCQIIVPEPPLAKTGDRENTPINIIPSIGMVTLLSSSNFQAHRSFITILHSTSPTTLRNQPPAQANDIQVICRSGKDITSTIAIMASFKLSTAASPRTSAIISWCTESVSQTAGKQSSQSANNIQLYSLTCTSIRRTRETSH